MRKVNCDCIISLSFKQELVDEDRVISILYLYNRCIGCNGEFGQGMSQDRNEEGLTHG